MLLSGLDVKCEACQRFFRDGLTISFTKILTDEAVSGWKFEIHVSSCLLYILMQVFFFFEFLICFEEKCLAIFCTPKWVTRTDD